jgi:hypothetical protein
MRGIVRGCGQDYADAPHVLALLGVSSICPRVVASITVGSSACSRACFALSSATVAAVSLISASTTSDEVSEESAFAMRCSNVALIAVTTCHCRAGRATR